MLHTIYLEKEEEVTWEEFLEVFKEKFFPKYIQDKKEKEFLELTQGGMTIASYEAKFSELGK